MSRGRSLILDRMFRGVGRIKRATGTNDPRLYKLLDAMLDTLYYAGRVDVLKAIRAGHLTMLEVWSHFRLGHLEKLPTIETMKPLKAELDAWLLKSKTGSWNRLSRTYGIRAILRLAKKDATIDDLPGLLRAYSATAEGPTMFNRARSAIQAYLRDTLGQPHRLYAEVRAVMRQKEVPRKGRPQQLAQLHALAAKMPPGCADVLWNMALTGMGPGELWGSWMQFRDHIHIEGTKRRGRVRDIPIIRAITRPTVRYREFLEALGTASQDQVLPYDLRKTYANWMESAGIPRARRKIYLGHGNADITDLYERHEVEEYLKTDGEKLRAFLGLNVGLPTLRRLDLLTDKLGSNPMSLN